MSDVVSTAFAFKGRTGGARYWELSVDLGIIKGKPADDLVGPVAA